MYKNGQRVRVGDRVERGPDWEKDNSNDGNPPGKGTVTMVDGRLLMIWVRWDWVRWDGVDGPESRSMGFSLGNSRTYRVQRSLADVAMAEKESYTETVMKERNKMFTEQKFSDVLIVCGDMTFNGHKATIAAKSDVFCKMFEDDMIEGQTNRVVVQGMESDTLKAMLRYIYTGCLDPEAQMMDLLLAAAHMYNIQPLKSRCEEQFLLEFDKEIKSEQVVDLLVFADMYDCKKIMESCLTFISSNKQKIDDCPNWRKIEDEHPKLMMKVLRKMNGFPDRRTFKYPSDSGAGQKRKLPGGGDDEAGPSTSKKPANRSASGAAGVSTNRGASAAGVPTNQRAWIGVDVDDYDLEDSSDEDDD